MRSIIDRLVFGQWLRVFGLAILATLGIILLQQMYDKLPSMLSYGASTGSIINYFFVAIPGFLPAIIPVALLISVLFSLSHMHRHNETLAMRAAGLNILRITRTLWVASLGLSAVMYFLNANWVPWSIERAKHLLQEMRIESLSETHSLEDIDLIFDLSYENHQAHRRWLMNRFNEPSYRAFGVHVYQLNERGRETVRILAKEAFYDDEAQEWVFLDGRRLDIDPASQEVERSVPFETHIENEWTESPRVMQLFSKRPKDLSMREVRLILEDFEDTAPELSGPYKIRYLSMMINPVICVVVVALSIPFAMSGVRTNPMIGLSKASALFFAYYIFSSIIELLGGQGVINPYVAIWIPIVVVLGISGLLYRKMS